MVRQLWSVSHAIFCFANGAKTGKNARNCFESIHGSVDKLIKFSPERLLCDVLWESCPSWMPSDLVAAEKKLAAVGVKDLNSFDQMLTSGLNHHLRKAGLKTFRADTITSFKRYHNKANGRVHADNKLCVFSTCSEMPQPPAEITKPLSNQEPILRAMLWECRPTWSHVEIQAVEHKLAQVGVNNVSALAALLSKDLNEQLRKAGLKAFSTETMKEFRRRLFAANLALNTSDTNLGKDDSDVMLTSDWCKHDAQLVEVLGLCEEWVY